jgi:hypothetical protein
VSNDAPSGDLSGSAVELLVELHAHKTAGYGDAWRKRGELLAIFTNLARKYDRLAVALDEGVRSGDERLLDTAGDLCIYASKYLTWLAEQHPQAFDRVPRGVTSADCADNRGPDALARILHALEVGPPIGIIESWLRLKTAFSALDDGLVAQAQGDVALAWEHKVELTWAIAASAAALLVAFAEREPDTWAAWRTEIKAMG